MFDLMIIGAGPGGYEAALHAARKGKSVLLVEKEFIGGTCLNVGCIPTKTWLHAARLYTEARQGALHGIRCSNVSFEMPALQTRKNEVVKKLTGGVSQLLKTAKVTTVMGEAKILEKGKVRVKDQIYEGRNILIATGSRPALPPLPGIDTPSLLDSTSILAITEIPSSLIIIGAGIIGVEFASFFAAIGTPVTIVEILDRICPTLDKEIASVLQRELEKQNVKFLLKSKVLQISGQKIELEQEGKKSTLTAERILVATGRRPNLENLGLEELKVDLTRSGIKVSNQGQTNISGIWACGDVTGRCLLAHSATREGQVAVNSMFGLKDEMRFQTVPAVVYSYPEVASVGLTEEQAQEKALDYRVIKKPLQIAGRFSIEHEKGAGLCKILLGKRYGEILGIHLIGGHCSEMIWGAVTLMELECRDKEVKEIVFPHPTVSEAIKETFMHA